MYYHVNQEMVNTEKYTVFRIGNCEVYYWGLMFVQGLKAGEESLRHIVDIHQETGRWPFIDMYGAYRLMIIDGDLKYFLTDHASQYCFFLSDDGKSISDSLLEMCRYNKNYNRLDENAVCEFLTLSSVFFRKTLVAGIMVSDDAYYYVEKDGILEKELKGIGDIDTPSSIQDFRGFFKALAYAVSENQPWISLSGGYDSRFVFALLNPFRKLTAMVAGGNEKYPDVVLSKHIAEVAGCSHEYIEMPVLNITDEWLWDSWVKTDGVWDGVWSVAPDFRLSFCKAKGCDLLINGTGGELYKDWYYYQDFPFYKRRKTDWPRFFRLRIERTAYRHYLSDKMQAVYGHVYENYMHELEKQTKTYNTQSYDAWSYNIDYRGRDHIYINTWNKIVSYGPLQELELVKYAYALPRFQRFFYMFMRKMTTESMPEIAKIPTNYGMTESSRFWYLLRDGFAFIFEMINKLMRYVSRKKQGNVVGAKLYKESYAEHLKKTEIYREAELFAKASHYIAEDVVWDNFPMPLRARLMSLCMLSKVLQGDR